MPRHHHAGTLVVSLNRARQEAAQLFSLPVCAREEAPADPRAFTASHTSRASRPNSPSSPGELPPVFPLFLIAWALGAWLLILCVALIWAERIRIYLRLPVCDNCGYSLEGLELSDRCPECNSNSRRAKQITGTPTDSPILVQAFLIPLAFAIATSIALSMVFNVTGIATMLVLAMFVLMGLLLSILTRSLVRWLPPAAIFRITLLGCLSIVLAAVWFGLITSREHLAHDLGLLFLLGALVWPFCGYGLAFSLLTLPTESWLRETMRRTRDAQSRRG
jgi:hypothetical protein